MARRFAAAPSGGSGRQYAPSREIDITHQRLEVTPDFDRRRVAGTVRIEFRPIAKPLDELKLDAEKLTISRVEASAGIRGWQNTGEQLVVTFQDAIPGDAASWVQVVYSAEAPEQGLYFRTPAMGYREGDRHLWTQGETHEARHWFPCYDYPNEKFTTELICHVPEGMVALSNGRLVSEAKDAGTGLVAWHWLQDKPHVNYLVTLCAGNFRKLEDRHGELPLAYWAPASKIALATNSFAPTKAMVAFYERETGVRYPWARYDQVVVDDFTWGGMENTTQTTLTEGTLYPPEFHGTRNEEGLIAHELVHQWFGDLVTTKDWANLWLNEGFATYYDALYQEHARGADAFRYQMLGNARTVLEQSNDVLPIVHRGYNDPGEQFGYRAYPKGSWILHMLRGQLGPDLYRRCIQTYLERHAYGVVTTEDFVAVIEELSGRDWDQFFDQYVYHAHHPELKVAYSWEERTKLAKVSIEQVQTLGPTVLLFNLPLKIRFKSGATMTDQIVRVSKATEDFYVALPGKPEIVRVDPDFRWLARVEFLLPDDQLFAQLADGSDLIGRVFAIEQLAKRRDKPVIEKLQTALNTDPFWGVRLEAAKALRSIHTEDARGALLASANQVDDRVRREVFQGLAGFFHADTPAALERLGATESNPDLKADLIRALGAYPVDQVQPTLRRALTSDSYQQVLARAALEAMRAQHDPVYVEPVLDQLRAREGEFTSEGFSEGLRALASLASELEDKTAVREFLVARVNHPKRSVQLATLEALGTLGDPRALPVLESFRAADETRPQQRVAAAAIRRIRERRPQSAEVGALRDEVLDLKQRNRELQEQFEGLKKQFEATKAAVAAPTEAPAKKKAASTRRRN